MTARFELVGQKLENSFRKDKLIVVVAPDKLQDLEIKGEVTVVWPDAGIKVGDVVVMKIQAGKEEERCFVTSVEKFGSTRSVKLERAKVAQ